MQRLALLLLLVFAAPSPALLADVAALVQEYTEAPGDEEKIVAIEYAATVGQAAVRDGDEETSTGIAELLGTAMWDESAQVQIRAVQLAGEGQRAAAVAGELYKRCEEAVSARQIFIKEARRKLAENRSTRNSSSSKDLQSGIQDGPIYPHVADQIGEIQRLGHSFVTKAEEIDALDAALIDSLDGLQDERAVAALVLLLEAQLAGSGGAIADALLRHGTVDALRQVLASLPAYEKRHRSASKEIAKLKKEKPGRMPKAQRRRRMDPEEWIKQEKERIRAALSQYQTVLFTREQLAESLKLSLVRFAKERGLPDPPKEILPAKKWSFWFKKVKDLLPEKVGEPAPEREGGN